MSERRRPFGPEGPECEWKEVPPAPPRLARTLAAFHNGVGGRLWVGVADDGRLVGLDDPAGARVQVERAADLVDPRPRLVFARRRLEGALLLEVQVHPGDGPAAVVGPRGGRRVYVRDGASSRPAAEAQVRRLERGRAKLPHLDERARRLLTRLGRRGPATRAELARALKTSARGLRRTLVPLLDGGLVMEAQGGRLSLTPRGHRRA
jgi:predicted HTH transcriptional regulator